VSTRWQHSLPISQRMFLRVVTKGLAPMEIKSDSTILRFCDSAILRFYDWTIGRLDDGGLAELGVRLSVRSCWRGNAAVLHLRHYVNERGNKFSRSGIRSAVEMTARRTNAERGGRREERICFLAPRTRARANAS
jgi:hypothetical protein